MNEKNSLGLFQQHASIILFHVPFVIIMFTLHSVYAINV